MSELYSSHIAQLQQRYTEILDQHPGPQGILIHSGIEQLYYADDQAPPFKAFGHFCNWLPVNSPNQLLLIVPGQRPVYFQVIPPDYWYDQTIRNADWWATEFDIVPLESTQQIGEHLQNPESLAFIGAAESFAAALGLDAEQINPAALLSALDYFRAFKTEYEVAQIKAANGLALQGHAAAQEDFQAGGSEYTIHMAYLQACGIIEQDCPYTSIVALNDKAAILHYQHKRCRLPAGEQGRVLLIDAGCRVNNYCSDITRTSVVADCNQTFRKLLDGMDNLQSRLVDEVRPGHSYTELHDSAIRLITDLAVQLQLVTCPLEQALELGLGRIFMPHGVGHLLGVQVHDVGGHLVEPTGTTRSPPAHYPFLRNTRSMEKNMVFTIEPGFYFIPGLLNPVRESARGQHLDWQLIDELTPLGGIRIEDNVRVTADGVENLTRG